jgi:L-amino acid N-acyltransferase YncA
MEAPDSLTIREYSAIDFPEVQIIYQLGIDTKNATFETTAPDRDAFENKFLNHLRLVATEHTKIIGWAALSAVSSRCVYAGVCEVSIYVEPTYSGKGIGKKLLSELIARSEKENIWTLQAGIFPENSASIKIHETLGFRKVGYREKIGQMDGVWRDTILLERRSKVVGLS